jgi:hypothetical protein
MVGAGRRRQGQRRGSESRQDLVFRHSYFSPRRNIIPVSPVRNRRL